MYDRSTWNYQESADMPHRAAGADPAKPATAAKAPAMLPPNVAYDLTLQHPRCVFQLLRKQYSRYTPEMVERITGISKARALEGSRPVHLHPQGRGHEEGRHGHLRGGLAAAYLRDPDHQHSGHPSVAPRQRWPPRRRRECSPRAFKYPGRDGHGRSV